MTFVDKFSFCSQDDTLNQTYFVSDDETFEVLSFSHHNELKNQHHINTVDQEQNYHPYTPPNNYYTTSVIDCTQDQSCNNTVRSYSNNSSSQEENSVVIDTKMTYDFDFDCFFTLEDEDCVRPFDLAEQKSDFQQFEDPINYERGHQNLDWDNWVDSSRARGRFIHDNKRTTTNCTTVNHSIHLRESTSQYQSYTRQVSPVYSPYDLRNPSKSQENHNSHELSNLLINTDGERINLGDYQPKQLTVADSMKSLYQAMKRSQTSQQHLYQWDRSMGLKISHSKTMRNSRNSRKMIQKLMRSLKNSKQFKL